MEPAPQKPIWVAHAVSDATTSLLTIQTHHTATVSFKDVQPLHTNQRIAQAEQPKTQD